MIPLGLSLVPLLLAGCDLWFPTQCAEDSSLPYCLHESCDEMTVTVDPVAAQATDGSLPVSGTARSGGAVPLGVRVAGEDATLDDMSGTWTVSIPGDRLRGLVVPDETCPGSPDESAITGRVNLPVFARQPCGDREWTPACSEEGAPCPAPCVTLVEPESTDDDGTD